MVALFFLDYMQLLVYNKMNLFERKMLMSKGIYKIATISPKINVADVSANCNEIVNMIEKAKAEKVEIIVFPELCVCGATCGDLFLQELLIEACHNGIRKICLATRDYNGYVIIGSPIEKDGKLFNCGLVISNGKVIYSVAKSNLSLDEKRWFTDGKEYQYENSAKLPFSLVIGENTFENISSNFIINISAVGTEVTKYKYLKNCVKNLGCGFIYASAGAGESTTDAVYSGACLVSENGKILAEGKRFSFDSEMIIAEINIADCNSKSALNEAKNESVKPNDPHPFIPEDKNELADRCEEILAIQSTGLAKRMLHTHTQKLVLGISGGLDSTLALLVAAKTMKKLGYSAENIICITMPGFGTTDLTYTNACNLVKSVGATLKEINIKNTCLLHFKDIGHDAEIHDVTYENTQARERTQILMDYANKIGALLVGTGDLSELALGWCTYNGDHMSMYGVNSSIPKTLMQYLVRYVADNSDENTAKILYSVLDTPISPELLPPDKNGKMEQKTENTLGPYEVHDYYLYHFIHNGTKPEKLLLSATQAFKGIYTEEELRRWLETFLRRFFISQFKRSCSPDGPKVGSVSLSPRGAWSMPSDACFNEWMKF